LSIRGVFGCESFFPQPANQEIREIGFVLDDQ
jgi:hypothetical protein